MGVIGRSRLLLTGVVILLAGFSLAPAGASSANISRSYHATTAIQNGSLLSLDPSKSDFVEAANVDNAKRLVGL